MTDNVKTMDSSNVLKCKSCNIVICEVLAFIQNKLDVMDVESLVRVCKTAFSEADLKTAKNLLFDSVATNKRKITRKRDGKSGRDLEDIINLMTDADANHVDIPIFVAKDLQKLPPVTFDHVDVTRLLKDIVILQSELRAVKETYVTEEQLMKVQNDLENLKMASIANNFDGNTFVNVNRRRGAYISDSYNNNLDSGPMGFVETTLPFSNSNLKPTLLTPSNVGNGGGGVGDSSGCQLSLSAATKSQSAVSFACAQTQGASQLVSATQPISAVINKDDSVCVSVDANIANAPPLCSAQLELIGAEQCNALPSQSKSQPTLAEVVKMTKCNENKNEGEWTRVERRNKNHKRYSGMIGKAPVDPNSKFRAAVTMIPLFVTNVAKEATVEDVIEYIFKKTQVVVKMEKITLKKKRNYCAYKVYVPKTKVALFLNDEYTWPMDIEFKRFIRYKKSHTPNGSLKEISDPQL